MNKLKKILGAQMTPKEKQVAKNIQNVKKKLGAQFAEREISPQIGVRKLID